MTMTDRADNELRDNRGNRYATAEMAAAATRSNEAADAEREARAKAAAEAWEDDLKRRYLSQPGTDEASWQRQRQDIVDEARKRAALSADDAAREANARRYAV